MPARALAFASLMLATGLNTVVGNSAEEVTAYNNAREAAEPACAKKWTYPTELFLTTACRNNNVEINQM